MTKTKESQAKPRKKNGCIVTKLVFCCKPNCSHCPHGPYAYHVTKHRGKQVWHYLGRADWTFTFSASQLISWLFGKTLETILSIAFLVLALGPPASFVASKTPRSGVTLIRVCCQLFISILVWKDFVSMWVGKILIWGSLRDHDASLLRIHCWSIMKTGVGKIFIKNKVSNKTRKADLGKFSR